MTFTPENIFFLGAVLIFASIDLGGRALVWIVNHINLPNPSLYPILVLCSILIIFTFTDMFQGNGQLELKAGDILLTIASQQR